jgi:CRP-like cAMP-binding protein
LFFSNQHVALQMIKMLAENVSEKEEQLLTLAYYSVRKRIAKALLFLDDKFSDGNQKKTEIRILRDDLAHLVGTAKESVIRMLTEFKDDGYINIVEGKIVILDPEKLENIPG